MPTPLTARDRELLAMPTLISQFPIFFDNNVCFGKIEGVCICCGKKLRQDCVRGLVSRPIPSVAVIEAVGVCNDCKLITRMDYRLHNDKRVTGLRTDGWKTWRPAPTLWERVSAIFKNPLA
jgi:hypothetical protein